MTSVDDTIAAIGTAPGDAGISIVRVSGPEAMTIADRVIRCRGAKPSHRPGGTFLYGHTAADEGDVDEVLVLIMRAPHSYTCEDMVEIQGHGGTESAKRNLRAVLDAGARLAEPGEFTRRAFLNGRIDLVQAEAVLDLIRARSDRAAKMALEQLEGRLSRQFNELYEHLIAIAADMEATLDFPEDELPAGVLVDVHSRLHAQSRIVELLIKTCEEGRYLREGAKVVIAGRPNVGKSTLLNSLLGSERAIVSSIPGTTRDTIEEGLTLDGIPLRLVDTAGLRATADEIESEGIRRARLHLEKADLYLYVIDASAPVEEEDLGLIRGLKRDRALVVLNKTDLGQAVKPSDLPGYDCVSTSLQTGAGLEALGRELARMLQHGEPWSSMPHATVSERHRQLLARARSELATAARILAEQGEDGVAQASANVREAIASLGEITGKVYQDELLTAIFSRFCIGK